MIIRSEIIKTIKNNLLNHISLFFSPKHRCAILGKKKLEMIFIETENAMMCKK